MGNIWFTSDFHFFHDKDFIYKARGFSSVYEMNEQLIMNYNNLVRPDDEVYILGDMCLNTTPEVGTRMARRLLGHKHLILGNHDTDNKVEMFKQMDVFESIEAAHILKVGKHAYFLCHYPTIVANNNERYVTCLCGHTHTKNPYQYYPDFRCLNVGLDAQKNCPINLDQVVWLKNNWEKDK